MFDEMIKRDSEVKPDVVVYNTTVDGLFEVEACRWSLAVEKEDIRILSILLLAWDRVTTFKFSTKIM